MTFLTINGNSITCQQDNNIPEITYFRVILVHIGTLIGLSLILFFSPYKKTLTFSSHCPKIKWVLFSRMPHFTHFTKSIAHCVIHSLQANTRYALARCTLGNYDIIELIYIFVCSPFWLASNTQVFWIRIQQKSEAIRVASWLFLCQFDLETNPTERAGVSMLYFPYKPR